MKYRTTFTGSWLPQSNISRWLMPRLDSIKISMGGKVVADAKNLQPDLIKV